MQQVTQWQFGPFRLDLTSRCLWRDEERVAMRPKTFEVLAALAIRAGEVVTKEVLLDTVWPDTAVSDTVLKVCLREIRQILGDSAKQPVYVGTVHRRGYQFLAAVEPLDRLDAAPDILEQVIGLLQRERRLAYRTLKRQFNLDDDRLEDLKDELIYSKQIAVDEHSRVLVWREDASPEPTAEAPLVAGASSITSRSALEGERKQVTVLFCDMVNSVAIADKIGPESMHALLNQFFELAIDVMYRYDGVINQFLGDGFMALYGAPQSLEDHAKRGVLAAIALRRALNESDLGHTEGVDCRFRMGLNSGLVVMGSIGNHLRMDYSAIGDTTNLASRLQENAKPGEILISQQTSRLVGDIVLLEALPPAHLKGKAEPVNRYRVLGRRPRQLSVVRYDERGLSPFVGRGRDLDMLDVLLSQVESGQGQVVGIVAEAGQGKSRLLYEWGQHLSGEEVIYLKGRCHSYGSCIPYYPIIDIVRHHCNIREADGPETILENMRQTLQELEMDAEDVSPYVLQLLGVRAGTEAIAALSPAVLRARTFETLKRMSLNASRLQPVMIEIEDLHWLDKTSESYLEALIDDLHSAPIMLLTTYRPGYRPPWIDKSYATQLSLSPLTPRDALTVVHAAEHRTALSTAATQSIVDKAEGNPFFLEELTRVIMDQDEDSVALPVPNTIQDVLMARIDRLSEVSKQLLRTASVLGREFSVTLLGAIWDEPEALEVLLPELKRLEFFYERIDAEDPVYVFKHALTQDVAYESLLTSHRQRVHAQAGCALERLHRTSLAAFYEELAHHFALGAVWDKAFDYLAKSGDKARQAFAFREATAFYTQAIEVSEHVAPPLAADQRLPLYEGRGLVSLQLTQLDSAIADFQIMYQLARVAGHQSKEGESLCRLARAHQMTFSEEAMPFVEQYAQEAYELAQKTQNRQVMAMSLTELGHLDAKQGALPEADQKFEAALQMSREDGNREALVLLLFALSRQANWQGAFQRAIEWGQEGVAISQEIYDGNNELTNSFFLALSCWGAGRYAQAFSVTQEALEKANARRNMLNIIRLTNTLGWFYREFGDLSRALQADHDSVEMGRTYNLPDPEISALINLGLDYLALGQYDQARHYLEPTLERVEHEAFGVHRWRWKIRLLIGLADLSNVTGALDQALTYLEDGLREAQATSSQKYMALGLALQSNVRAKLGQIEMVEEPMRRAFALAKQLGSPSLVYPVAHDFGQWCEQRGQESHAAAAYARAHSAIEHMVTRVEDDALRSTLLQTSQVKAIQAAVQRLPR